MTSPERKLLGTAEGTRSAAFGPTEWGLLATAAVVWGSSFLFIEVGLEAFSPGLITSLRILFGAVTLGLLRQARTAIEPEDRLRIVFLAVVWMAIPFILFPIAQQWISSALAGMLNAAMPLYAAAIAALMLRRLPKHQQAWGLIIGFGGVVVLSLQEGDAEGSSLGVALVLIATALYGLAVNLAVPLQQKYGAIPVLYRALVVAFVLTLPLGIASVPSSSFEWPSILAVVGLGVGGTGIAYVAMTTLVGRTGATRGAVAIYFIPIVAVVLGVTFLDESVAAAALAGVVLVLFGAFLTSRREAR